MPDQLACLALGRMLGVIAALLAGHLPQAALAGQALRIDDFPPSGEAAAPPWRLVRFDEAIPPTRYRLEVVDGRRAMTARAEASMALLGRSLPAQAGARSVLCWQWRIDAPLRAADLQRREGDDYAARVYVGVRLPREALGVGTRLLLSLARARHGPDVPDAAINYVWDNRYPLGTQAANAYTDRAHMVVVESGAARAGGWVQERRDIRADIERAFGAVPESLTLVAIGSDTDNTGEVATAAFAGLALVDAGDECPRPDAP